MAVGPPLREHLVHRVWEQHEGYGSHGHCDGQQHLAAPETDRVRGRELGPSRLLERVAPQGAVHRSGIQATLPRGRQPLLQPEPEVGRSHEADRSRAGGHPGHRDCGERDRHAEGCHAQRLFQRDEPGEDHHAQDPGARRQQGVQQVMHRAGACGRPAQLADDSFERAHGSLMPARVP